jgi:rubrerythrin
MAKSIRGTKTEKNLLAAFAGEAQARNRYTYFASAAKKEGYEQIAAIFLETAENEKEHAKVFFKYLEGGEVEITAAYPAGVIGDTAANLKAAADGEKHEWSNLYAEFERVAREEGFPEIGESFHEIAEVEQFHETRYRKLAANVANGEVFSFKVSVDGDRVEKIVEGQALNPVWSPAGDLIVYTGQQVNAFVTALGVRPDGTPVELPPLEILVPGQRVRFLQDGRGLIHM